MIPVQPQPEPTEFSKKIREPGEAFLKKVPHPKYKDWKDKEYWRKSIPELYEAYNQICAYSAQWIPLAEGTPTVDHFIPKSVKPELAYEWKNFRLACLKLNSNKGDYQDVIDPFIVPSDCFIIDFPSLLIKPNPELPAFLKEKVIKTIKRLKLNEDDKYVKGRLLGLCHTAKRSVLLII